MPPKPKAQTPVGASVHRGREIPPSSETVLEMFSEPLPCFVFDPAAEPSRRLGGTLYRDPDWGPSVRIAESWESGQEIGPRRANPSVMFGRTADRIFFTMKDAEIESWPHVTEINAWVLLTGAWVPEDEWRFDNITVAIDAFADFLHNPDQDGELAPTTAGSVTIRPKRLGTHPRYQLTSNIPALELVDTERHTLKWWLDEWVNPLIRLVAIGTGFPCTATAITTDGPKFDGADEAVPWHFVGGRWPTLQTEAHDGSIATSLPLDPLFWWISPGFDIATAMDGIRRIYGEYSFVGENYAETIRSERNWRDRFLQMVQSIESIHAGDGDRTDPRKTRRAEGILARLEEKGVSSKDRKYIRSALEDRAAIGVPLWERVKSMSEVAGLPGPPAMPPTWDDATGAWPEWIGQARNKISHGNPGSTAPEFKAWVMRQSPYLQCMVEVWLMQQLGFPTAAAVRSSVERYRQSVGPRWRE